MKQIVQNYKTGKISIEEIPIPLLEGSGVIVKNYFSLISAGTERTKVDMVKKSLIGKAKSRPDLVQKVIGTIKTKGLINAAKSVFRKLDEYRPLGYSSCGKVVDLSKDIENLKIGDFIACGGAGYANHAEYIYVPKNLFCKVPDNIDLIDASFVTVGSVAMQAVRLLNSQIGEKVLVIGLGLVGQLVVQILNAYGIGTFGMDIEKNKVNKGKECGLRIGSLIDSPDLNEKVNFFTGNRGFDGVIITASTDSNKPIELAGRYCREKGNVIVVGQVSMNIPRDDYYRKEINIVISRSYGPGRYDGKYEEKGIDYPYGYVRWTENRNMKSFIDLINNKRIDVKKLISEVYELNDYMKAYECIYNNKAKDYYGLVLKYDVSGKGSENKIIISESKIVCKEIKASFIGSGGYAQKFLVPLFAKNSNVSLYSILSSTGLSAKNVGKKYNFKYVPNNIDDIFLDDKSNLVVISTRHDTHAKYIIKALENKKNIFTEKPLCINKKDLEKIRKAYNDSNSILMIGFNRRFSGLIKKLIGVYKDRNYPLVVNYRINAGKIDRSHWIQDPDIGGGRIVGELCHFIDLTNFIVGKKVQSIYSSGIGDNKEVKLIDDLITNIEYKDGSIGSITYVSNGSKLLFKEYIEVYGGGITVIIKDFKTCEIYKGNNIDKIDLRKQDKGQFNEINEFIDSLIKKGKSPISFSQIYNSTSNTFSVIDSLRSGRKVTVGNE